MAGSHGAFFGRLSWCFLWQALVVLFLAGSRGAFFLAGSYYVLASAARSPSENKVTSVTSLRGERRKLSPLPIAARDPPLTGVLPSASVGNTNINFALGVPAKK